MTQKEFIERKNPLGGYIVFALIIVYHNYMIHYALIKVVRLCLVEIRKKKPVLGRNRRGSRAFVGCTHTFLFHKHNTNGHI